MRKTSRKIVAAVSALALVGACAAVGLAPQTKLANSETVATSTDSTANAAWRAAWPAEYYSFANGADDMDDMGGFITKTGNTHSHATLFTNMGEFSKSTCISCKSSKFNEWYDEYGSDVFYDRYNKDTDNRWIDDLQADDVWSCTTCHTDIANPSGTVGAQIVTFQKFGNDLLQELDPETAACGQCHNGLGPWNNLRILDGRDIDNEDIQAYRYGWDADSMLKATLEDATATSESPNGKTYTPTKGSHAQCDESLDIYRIDNGGHFDVEIFQGSVMQQAGLTCTDCHMPKITTETGETFTSHDASGSPLDSYSALTKCLDCHKNQGIETQEDMVAFVRNAQDEVAQADAAVAAKQDQLFPMLQDAISNAKFDEDTLDKARYNYAVAAYYKEYAFNEAEKAGEKIAHNPDVTRQLLKKADSLLDDTIAMLS